MPFLPSPEANYGRGRGDILIRRVKKQVTEVILLAGQDISRRRVEKLERDKKKKKDIYDRKIQLEQIRKENKIRKSQEKARKEKIQIMGRANRAIKVAAKREERIQRIRQSTGEANKKISETLTNVTGVLRRGAFVTVLGAGVVLSDVLASTLCVAEAAVTFTYVTLAQVSLFAVSLAGEAAGHFNKGQIGEWGISLSGKMGDTRQSLGYHFKRRMGDIGDRWKRNISGIHHWAGEQISGYCRKG